MASSGHFITSYASDYLPRKLSDYRILYVTTAGQKVGDDIGYMQKRREWFTQHDVDYLEFDLTEKSQQEVETALGERDLLYVEGGNTFYLLKAVNECGFGDIVQEFLNRGGVYLGASAGSYICCPDISVMNWSGRGFDRCGMKDLTAMGLVDFCIKAHMTPEKVEKLKNHQFQPDYPVRCITDQQAFMIEGDTISLVGKDEEIQLS